MGWAGLELLAMIGYAALIAVVGYRTDRRRVGLYGIGIGAVGGSVAVGVAIAGVVGFFEFPFVALRVPIILNGFLIPTIVGYSYQFFPVTNGQFRGATPRTALTMILSIGVGTGIQSFGALYAVQLIKRSVWFSPLPGLLATRIYSVDDCFSRAVTS